MGGVVYLFISFVNLWDYSSPLVPLNFVFPILFDFFLFFWLLRKVICTFENESMLNIFIFSSNFNNCFSEFQGMIFKNFPVFLCLILSPSSLTTGYRLNVPRVLLPFHPTSQVKFNLMVTDPDGGCFKWFVKLLGSLFSQFYQFYQRIYRSNAVI